MKRPSYIFISALIVSSLSLSNVFAEELTACVNNKTGALRLKEKCKKSERSIIINTTNLDTQKGEPNRIKAYDKSNQPLGYLLGHKDYEVEIYLPDLHVTAFLYGGDVSERTWYEALKTPSGRRLG